MAKPPASAVAVAAMSSPSAPAARSHPAPIPARMVVPTPPCRPRLSADAAHIVNACHGGASAANRQPQERRHPPFRAPGHEKFARLLPAGHRRPASRRQQRGLRRSRAAFRRREGAGLAAGVAGKAPPSQYPPRPAPAIAHSPASSNDRKKEKPQ